MELIVINLPLWGQALGVGIFVGWAYMMLKMSDKKYPNSGWVGRSEEDEG